MTWGRLDDTFYRHRKVMQLREYGPRVWADAIALWLMALSYANDSDTGGWLPSSCLQILVPFRGREKAAKALVDVGLWERQDDGWMIHDFSEYNPTDEKKTRERELTRERVRRHRKKKRERNGVTGGAGNAVTDASVTGGVTDTPYPTPKEQNPERDTRACAHEGGAAGPTTGQDDRGGTPQHGDSYDCRIHEDERSTRQGRHPGAQAERPGSEGAATDGGTARSDPAAEDAEPQGRSTPERRRDSPERRAPEGQGEGETPEEEALGDRSPAPPGNDPQPLANLGLDAMATTAQVIDELHRLNWLPAGGPGPDRVAELDCMAPHRVGRVLELIDEATGRVQDGRNIEQRRGSYVMTCLVNGELGPKSRGGNSRRPSRAAPISATDIIDGAAPMLTEAVEAGDEERLQAMVEEVAEAAGVEAADVWETSYPLAGVRAAGEER